MTRSFDVLEKAAENENGMAGAAVGLGAGVGIGGVVGAMTAQTISTHSQGADEIPPIPTTDYYLAIDGKRQGPFDPDTIAQKISNNEITENTLIWIHLHLTPITTKNITPTARVNCHNLNISSIVSFT